MFSASICVGKNTTHGGPRIHAPPAGLRMPPLWLLEWLALRLLTPPALLRMPTFWLILSPPSRLFTSPAHLFAPLACLLAPPSQQWIFTLHLHHDQSDLYSATIVFSLGMTTLYQMLEDGYSLGLSSINCEIEGARIALMHALIACRGEYAARLLFCSGE